MSQLSEFTHPIRPDPDVSSRSTLAGDRTQGGDRPRTVRADKPGRAPADDSLRGVSLRRHSSGEQLGDPVGSGGAGPEDRLVRSVRDTKSRQRSAGVEGYVRRHPIHGVLTAMTAGVLLARVLKR